MIKALVSTVLVYCAFNFLISPYFGFNEISIKMAFGIGCIIGLFSMIFED